MQGGGITWHSRILMTLPEIEIAFGTQSCSILGISFDLHQMFAWLIFLFPGLARLLFALTLSSVDSEPGALAHLTAASC